MSLKPELLTTLTSLGITGTELDTLKGKDDVHRHQPLGSGKRTQRSDRYARDLSC